MNTSDLIIIGAGPGGYETALDAARQGLSVTIFEQHRLGGVCLNHGCIPTKCLCRNAEVVAQMRESEIFGIDEFQFSLDFNKVIERKNSVVAQLRDGISQMMKMAKVNVVEAHAQFVDACTVEADSQLYTAKNIIIATGSRSRSLPIPGAELECVMDSNQMLEIDHIPESLTIIGGGVIGMEFAGIFSAMGSKVTVIEYCKQILPPFDADIAKRLKQNLQKKGINIITSAAAKSISQTSDYEINVVYESKGKEYTVTSTDLLMAVGRAPMVEGLGLENTRVEFSPKGIVVNENLQTNVSGIYAIGDVNGKMMLAHVASFQGKRALHTILGESDQIDFNIVPSAVFTVPECGMVGLTESQCKEKGIDIKIGTSFFRANGKALAMAEPDGLCKLIFHAETQTLLGAHIMGAQAADLAQQCGDLMARHATLDEIKSIIFGHPTISEVIMSAVANVK